MSLFVDTGVLYAHHDTDASRHAAARTALTSALKAPAYGRLFTSEYVYDEAVTLTYRRTNRMDAAIELGRRIRGADPYPQGIDLLHPSREQFTDATGQFEQYADQGLSFTDAMTVVLVEQHDIDSVLSFDDDFDGLVDRLAPGSVAHSE